MKKWIAIFAVVGLMAASCAKVQEAPLQKDEIPPVKTHTVTLSATIDSELTKTAYAENRIFSWTAGDQISVLFYKEGQNKFFTFTATSGGSSSTTFTGEVEDGYELGAADGSHTQWALFPANGSHTYTAGNNLSYHMPTFVDQSSHESANVPMAAQGDGAGNFVFYHISGAYKFTFTGVEVSKVRLVVRTAATHQLSGDFPLTVNSASDINWAAKWAEDGSDVQSISIVKNVGGDGSVSFYIPVGDNNESEFQPVVILKDEATGNMLLRSSAKLAFNSSALKPLRSRMVVLPSVAAPGTGKPLISKFGIDWDAVAVAKADAYNGITIRGYSPDDEFLYLYFEVDKSDLDLDTEKGKANSLQLFIGNENSSSTDWKWAYTPNTYDSTPSIAWLTRAGKASYYNRAADLILDSSSNECSAKNVYEIKIPRFPVGESATLSGEHTAHIGAVVYSSLYDGGGNWNTYYYSPYHSLLEVPMPGVSGAGITPPDADPTLTASYSNRITYTEAAGAVVNPERGFHKNAGNFFSGTAALSSSAVTAARVQGYSLMYVGFYLTDFVNSAISDDYLTKIRNSLAAFRGTGVKCILRFAYSNGHADGDKPWDASKERVLSHIEQLKPILQEYKDVIFVLQAGFVGSWGEWYYSDNFGNEGSPNFTDRKAVVDALLAALPEQRQVALRTPQAKIRMYGNTPITELTAHHADNPISRIAGHNDCFKASSTDSGTFGNEEGDRALWMADSKYVIMGGESCKLSEYCNCSATLSDLENYHWTYLNNGYREEVLAKWKNSGCYMDILNRLGYRLVLMDSYYTLSGTTLSLALRINNKGFAAPMNSRNAKLVFVPTAGEPQVYELGSDPRTWYSGITTVEKEIELPSATGTLYLNLSDPLIPDDPKYSIAFANANVFNSVTGYNKLLELN